VRSQIISVIFIAHNEIISGFNRRKNRPSVTLFRYFFSGLYSGLNRQNRRLKSSRLETVAILLVVANLGRFVRWLRPVKKLL
jgi:hypothetical protein